MLYNNVANSYNSVQEKRVIHLWLRHAILFFLIEDIYVDNLEIQDRQIFS